MRSYPEVEKILGASDVADLNQALALMRKAVARVAAKNLDDSMNDAEGALYQAISLVEAHAKRMKHEGTK